MNKLSEAIVRLGAFFIVVHFLFYGEPDIWDHLHARTMAFLVDKPLSKNR